MAHTSSCSQIWLNHKYTLHMSSQLPKEDVKVIMGDWNAKVGDENTGSEEVMEKYIHGNKN